MTCGIAIFLGAARCTVIVSGLIVRGIFLSTPKEIHWFYQEGASQFYPDYWDDFLQPIPEAEKLMTDQSMGSLKELQELDLEKWELKGERSSVWRGACGGCCVEGPHVYKVGEAYYLMVAEAS